jgi:hypothetical protein
VLWFGGSSVHPRLVRRLVRYGQGFNPLGSPSDEELDQLEAALVAAGRSTTEIEYVGGTRGRFADERSVADLDEALSSIPAQMARGFRTICIKPSQFIDDAREMGEWCKIVVDKVRSLCA